MIGKSKQLKAEENKTLAITDLVKLRFKMLKPYDGVIEVVNSADQGRICTIKISDFGSVRDAQVYGQLLVFAPQILAASLTDAEKLVKIVKRFQKVKESKERGRVVRKNH